MGKLSFAEKFKNLFAGKNKETQVLFEDLTDALIEGDIGAKNAVILVDQLENICRESRFFPFMEARKSESRLALSEVCRLL